MGIPYDPIKPAANDKPANDQAPMQTNFASIKTLIDVDHVDFSNADYGKHLQVTFASNNVPSLPAATPVLFTDAVSGLPQLKFFSGDAAHSSNQYVALGNGSTFALGGIVIKWGTANFSGSNLNGSTSFASAFPNTAFSVTATLIAGSPGAVGVSVNTLTTSGFSISRASGATSNQAFYYVAIGN